MASQHAARRRWVGIAAVVSLVLGLLALWRLTPLRDWTEPERITGLLEVASQGPWAPLILGGVYLAATVVLFPVLALNLALILVLGPLWGVAGALYGTLLAGLAAFAIGRRFGRAPLRGLDSAALDKALRVIRNSGLPGMILFRLVPVAPYPVVNLALGAGGIGIGTFTLGTAIGVLPSLIAMGVVGAQFQSVLDDPNARNIGMLLALVLACLALGWWVKRRLSGQLADT